MTGLNSYSEAGFEHLRSFFSETQLSSVEPVLRRFHEQWLSENSAFYETGAINSAYITHEKSLSREERNALFSFIADKKIMQVATAIIPGGPAFMNTQLFFDPAKPEQKNYWHRDIQYVPHSLEEQERRFNKSTVLHFRIPFADERGIDLIPGTHRRWDTERELETRLSQNGRIPSDDLPNSQAIPLKRGDLLVFNANMIHRGLYGGDRFAFDIIFCDADPELLRFVDPVSLPDRQETTALSRPDVFIAAQRALAGK